MLFYVLSNFTNAEIESLVEKLQAEQEKFMSVNKLYIAVSKTDCNIKSLSKTYQIVLKMLKLSQRRNISPMFYEKLEIKKLILAVDDIQAVLEGKVPPVKFSKTVNIDIQNFHSVSSFHP